MKTQRILTAILGLLLFTAIACQEENTEPETTMVSEEEAVEVIESALVADSEGMAQEAEEIAAASEAYGTESNCGLSGDSTLVRSLSNPNITAAYTIEWSWNLICEGNLPQTLVFSRSTEGNYETNRMLSEDSSESDWSIGNILIGQEYVVNGTYQRQGEQTSKINDMNTFSSVLNIQYDDVTVNKFSETITGGSGTFQFSGISSTGQTTEHTGSIEFLGGQEAVITINGNTYVINW